MRIVVAGGGIVGLTAGLAFKQAGWDVLIVEQAPEIRAAGAAIGLWRNALDVFRDVGVGEAIEAIGRPIETWFFDASGKPFRAPEYSLADHSFLLVPRPELNRTLAEAVGHTNIRVNAKVLGYVEHSSGVTVRLSDGSTEEADLLLGADGVYSRVRAQLVPGFDAREHAGHHVWRGLVPTGDEPSAGSVLTVGSERTRGGYTLTYGEQTVWMVNQFDSVVPTGSSKAEALARAAHLNEVGWNDPLIRLIERTPDQAILHNQIMFVPELPRWSSRHVALIGDAAHGLSPHISAGGTLGVEDVKVLVREVQSRPDLASALAAYERNRMPHYRRVHQLAQAVEDAADAQGYARTYARFSHWMLNDGAAHADA
jgi:2-polyprenyl-6-methoxyphenol hydroxylase-like FAD-dependent oxidoreductase